MPSNSRHLPRSIWALGFVSLLMDTSSEIVHGLLPVFLVSILGASFTIVGLLEGMAEGVSLILKVFSGPFSDWLGKRKPLVVLGYTMGALSKPLFALAHSVPVVFGARIFDRMGKGIRGAPRDAMVADLAPPGLRGKAFGLRQSLDTVGAFLGPLLAIGLMVWTHSNYRAVFWLATIPGLLCVGLLFFGVKEEKSGPQTKKNQMQWKDLKEFAPSFWFVVGAGALFQLARFSEAFLILRAKDFGLPFNFAPLVLIVMNIIYSLSAYPVGHFSDKMRREWFLWGGLLVLMISDVVLGFGTGLISTFIGIMLWGFHLGLTQGTLAALVADTCLPERRGTAYGLFNFFSAAMLLLASLIAGILWEQLGPKATFLVGAGFSFLSLLAFSSTKAFWNQPEKTSATL
jgi:MFS family permease